MRSFVEQRARLARMEAARAETERHLAVLERQIEARAERMTTSTRVKARQFGRGEIEALTRKLAPQAGAVAAFRVRHRINKPEREAVS